MYAPRELLLAYGISFLCALACSCVGLHAFFINDASYQNVFSTFLRATNDLEVRSQISENDKGSDPLPNALAKATVTLNGSHELPKPNSTGADRSDIELQLLPQDHSDSVSVTLLTEATAATTGSRMHSREIDGTSPHDSDIDNRSLPSAAPEEESNVAPAIYLSRSPSR